MLDTQSEMLHSSCGQEKSDDSCRLRDLAGGYYRVLGWIDVAFSAIALGIWRWTGHLSITFSFVFMFWLGSSLKRGNPPARKWAIAIPFLLGIVLVVGAVSKDLRLRITPWGIDQTHSAYIPYAISDLVILTIPAIMLLGERGRRAFTEPKQLDQDGTVQSSAGLGPEGGNKSQPESEGRPR